MNLSDSIIFKGGWVMVPIILGSIVALGITINRGIRLWKLRGNIKVFADSVLSMIKDGNINGAMSLCDSTKHPLARVFKTGIENRMLDIDIVERMMEHEGKAQIEGLEKNMNTFLVVIGIEPMLGFLGTILGLIQAFMSWEQYSTSVTVEQLASGIYSAMITTAAGLTVAIPYYVVYHVFLHIINKSAGIMNHHGERMLFVLKAAGAKKK
jgi:biopolymer transport protein ExbB